MVRIAVLQAVSEVGAPKANLALIRRAAVRAADAGADIIGTTLAGYTGDREKTSGPDLEFLHELAELDLGLPLIAEGRIHTPAQGRAALDAGAFAVVVGTAITHPATITGWFADALVP